MFKRDAPIAEIVPVDASRSRDETLEPHLRRLEREGVIRRGSAQIAEELLEPPAGDLVDVLDALLGERASGR